MSQLIFDIRPTKSYAILIKCLHIVSGIKWGFVGSPGRVKHVSSKEVPIKISVKPKKSADIVITLEHGALLASKDTWGLLHLQDMVIESATKKGIAAELLTAIKSHWSPCAAVKKQIEEAAIQSAKHSCGELAQVDLYLSDCMKKNTRPQPRSVKKFTISADGTKHQ